MYTTTLTDNPTLLEYAIHTNPDPLTVSTDTGQSISSVTIVASCPPDTQVFCDKIILEIAIGDGPTYLTDDGAGIHYDNPADTWDMSYDSAGTFTLDSKSGEPVDITSKQSWTFHIYNIKVNKQVGTTLLTIDEHSSPKPGSLSKHESVIKLSKFPYGFYAGNFRAEKPVVKNGETATLTWEGSGNATYKILYGPDPTIVDVSRVRTWMSSALKDSTNFILDVNHQHDGETVHTYFSTVVSVLNPSITTRDLTVLGNTSLQGSTTTAALTAQSILDNGNLNVNGQVGMIGNAVYLEAGNYSAKTDGMVIGNIIHPSDPSKVSLAWISGSTVGLYVQATGGNNVDHLSVNWIGKISWDSCNFPSSFCLPVKKGNRFILSIQYGKGNQEKPGHSFTWIPFGSDSGETVEKISETDSDKSTNKIPRPKNMLTELNNENAFDGFVDVMEEMVGKKVMDKNREDFKKALLDLFCRR